MRKGFDQNCPDCYYASQVNKVFGTCYCKMVRAIVSRKRFPPQSVKSAIPQTCASFKHR